MPISIFHVGLPLDHPSIPKSESPKVAKRLTELQERMRAAGYNYEFIHCSPETGLEDLKDQLRTRHCDGVLIGGGVVSNPEMSCFLEQMVDVIHAVAPAARVMLHDHSVDVLEMVERNFKPVAE